MWNRLTLVPDSMRFGFRGRTRRGGWTPLVEACERRELLVSPVPVLTVAQDAPALVDPDRNTLTTFTISIPLNTQSDVVVQYYTTDVAPTGVCAARSLPGNPDFPDDELIDYSGIPQTALQTLTFPSGTTDLTVNITVIGGYQRKPEVDFTLHVEQISPPPGTAPPTTAQTFGRILNDNGLVVENTNASGYHSLFGAISTANLPPYCETVPPVSTITFDIPASEAEADGTYVIQPAGALRVQRPTVIDGRAQPGFHGTPVIVVDGTRLGSAQAGLAVESVGCEILGLDFRKFDGPGIDVNVPPVVIPATLPATPFTGTIIQDTIVEDVGGDGIVIEDGDSNLIANNRVARVGGAGIILRGKSDTIDLTLVRDNQVVNTGGAGIDLGPGNSNQALGNTVLSPADIGIAAGPAAFNALIANNLLTFQASLGADGVVLRHGTTGSMVASNRILGAPGFGVNLGISTGTNQVLGNTIDRVGEAGILLQSANDTTVAGNVVHNPAQGGIFLLSSDGITLDGNVVQVDNPDPRTVAPAILVAGSRNGALTRNLINGSSGEGILLQPRTGLDLLLTSSDDNVIDANIVIRALGGGIVFQRGSRNRLTNNVIGMKGLGSGLDGIALLGKANDNTVGLAGQGNTIVDSGVVGLRLGPLILPNLVDPLGPSGNRVVGNTIGAGAGTPPTGVGQASLANGPSRSGLGNHGGGIFLDRASGNFVGGAGAGEGNLVADNGGPGVQITLGGSNVVQGNTIGTDPNGTRALGNALDGIYIDRSDGNRVLDNLVSANGLVGARLSGPQTSGSTEPTASNNTLQGNTIGTDRAGNAALGNVFDGVFALLGASNNQITGNQIAGNGGVGVQFAGASTSGNTLADNRIGTDRAGTRALVNLRDGVFLNNAPNHVIGLPGLGNVIAAPPRSGAGVLVTGGVAVVIAGASATGNTVQANRINSGISGLARGVVGVFLADAPGNSVVTTGANANVIGGPAPDRVVPPQGGGGVGLVGGPLTGARRRKARRR